MKKPAKAQPRDHRCTIVREELLVMRREIAWTSWIKFHIPKRDDGQKQPYRYLRGRFAPQMSHTRSFPVSDRGPTYPICLFRPPFRRSINCWCLARSPCPPMCILPKVPLKTSHSVQVQELENRAHLQPSARAKIPMSRH